MSMRYQTLAELRDAYAKGEVTEPLTLDNDTTFLYVPETPDGSAGSDDDWVEVFDGGHPHELLEAALDLLGIPHEDA